jgi:hypothetical protein
MITQGPQIFDNLPGAGEAEPAVTPAPRGWTAPLVLATVAGVILAIALGWTLLTLALSLMFMLGLFFFMLFGLLIGAVMYRIAAPTRPVTNKALWTASIIVAFAGWSTAIYKEATDFPNNFTDAVVRNYKQHGLYVPSNDFAKVETELHEHIVGYLAEHYPPGGRLGYLRMAARGAPIRLELPSQPRTLEVPARVAAWAWWTRVLLALVLMAFAVHALIGSLRNATEPARPKAAVKAEHEG